jgi:opacity protein-like surface antigen
MDIKKVAKLKPYFFIVACFLIIPTHNIFADVNNTKTFLHKNSYIGLDLSFISEMIKSNYTFQSGYGKNSYAKNPFMYGVFVGHKFTDRFGIEVEYETQANKKRTVTLGHGDELPGNIMLDEDSINLQTSEKTEHWQILLHSDIYRFHKINRINLWVQLGMSYSRVRAEQIALSGIVDGDQIPENSDQRTFRLWKVIPVAKLGVNYDWTKKIGFRASAGWRHLHMLKAKSEENPTGSAEIRLKDGVNCALGIYFKF